MTMMGAAVQRRSEQSGWHGETMHVERCSCGGYKPLSLRQCDECFWLRGDLRIPQLGELVPLTWSHARRVSVGSIHLADHG